MSFAQRKMKLWKDRYCCRIVRRYKHSDELSVVRFFMKVACCWPENQKWWKKIIQVTFWPTTPAYMLPIMIWYLATEGRDDEPAMIIQTASDTMAMVTFITRGIIILTRASEVYAVSELLKNSFTEFEKEHKLVQIRRSRLVWFPATAFAFVMISSCLRNTLALFAEPDHRDLSVKVHSYVIKNDWCFYPLIGFLCFRHFHTAVLNAISDGLIICTATVMQSKAEMLKTIIADLDKVTDKEQQAKEIKKIVQYHSLIYDLFVKVDRICSGPLLVQVSFLVMSLGSPGFRVLYTDISSLPAEMYIFIAAYLGWVGSQLATYCLVCDAATTSCSSIGYAAYEAYRPDMDPKTAKCLVLIMAKSSRPLFFTARKLIKIHRPTLLKLIKQSYSFYSAIINLK